MVHGEKHECPYCGLESFIYMVAMDKWNMFVPKELQKKCICLPCLIDLCGSDNISKHDFMGVPINVINYEKISSIVGDIFQNKFIKNLSSFIKSKEIKDQKKIVGWFGTKTEKLGLIV